MPPELQRIHDEYMAALERRERAALNRLTRAYGEIWKRLRDQLQANLDRFERERAAGIVSTPNVVFSDQRLRALLAQVEREIGVWARAGADATEQLQNIAAGIGLDESEAAMAAAFDAQLAGIENAELRDSIRAYVSIRSLAKDAIKSQIGFLGDGSPLARLFDQIGPQVRAKWTQLLVQALALGTNPREVARQARRATGMGLARGLTIARTEMLRTYREAHHRNFQANDNVVGAWVWVSAADARTCPACWALHGTIHPHTEKLTDHPNGRCVPVPYTRSWEEILGERGKGIPETRPQFKTGEELFARLGEDAQRKILGSAAYEAWKVWTVTLSDFIGVRRNPQWGDMHYARSLRQARANSAGRVPAGTARGTVTASAVRQIYERDLGDGVQTSVRTLKHTSQGALVRVDITQHGKNVGTATRRLDFVALHAHHDYFALADDLQERGIGTRYYFMSERAYVQLGVKRVSLLANITSGGYAWARMGFDFESEEERRQMWVAIRNSYERAYGPKGFRLSRDARAWDMADFKGPDGAKIGKEVMYGSSWHGFKDLTDGSIHRLVGDAYLASRTKR